MNMMARKKMLSQYQQTNVNATVEGATPHRLVAMLYEGALSNLAKARGAMERKDFAQKGVLISKTIAILSSLRAGLDKDKASDISDNLDSLYDYMNRRLFQANSQNDIAILDEIASLIREIKEAWDQMPPQFRNATREQIEMARSAS